MVVDLVAVAVALVDDLLAVDLAGPRALVQLHRVGAQAHRAAHVAHLLLLRQEVDHRERGLRIELRGVRTVHARHVAGELGHRDLHPQADAEVGNPVLACIPRRADLALDAADAEPAGDEDPVALSQVVDRLAVREPLRVDPADLDVSAVVGAGVAEGLDDRQVGVRELGVLADKPDPHGRGRPRRRA